MNINLGSLCNNLESEININNKLIINDNLLKNVSIKELVNTYFEGKITRIDDYNFSIVGILKGTMILPDDITLENVNYDFSIKIDEIFGQKTENSENNLEIVQNTIDILPFLWQNIIVEIPLKVVSEKNQNKTIEGNGWRLISEDQVNIENNSPFSDLQKMLDSKGRSE